MSSTSGIAAPGLKWSRPAPAQLTLILGTTNSKINLKDNPHLNEIHGRAWANMITQTRSELLRGYAEIIIAAGIDAELDTRAWSTYAQTSTWYVAYNAVGQYPIYNFGDCNDCPRQEPQPWDNIQLTSLEAAYQYSWPGLAEPFPQIYYGEYAYQWFNVVRYGREAYDQDVELNGVASSCTTTGCNVNDSRDWTAFVPAIEGRFLSPRQARNALSETLNATLAPDGTPNETKPQYIKWVTDFANGAAN